MAIELLRLLWTLIWYRLCLFWPLLSFCLPSLALLLSTFWDLLFVLLVEQLSFLHQLMKDKSKLSVAYSPLTSRFLCLSSLSDCLVFMGCWTVELLRPLWPRFGTDEDAARFPRIFCEDSAFFTVGLTAELPSLLCLWVEASESCWDGFEALAFCYDDTGAKGVRYLDDFDSGVWEQPPRRSSRSISLISD